MNKKNDLILKKLLDVKDFGEYLNNPLEEAEKIVFTNAFDTERKYGPFNQAIDDVSRMATIMSRKKIDASDVYNILIALKLCRDGHTKKYDNIMDAIAYLGAKYRHHSNEYDATTKPEDKPK